MELNIVSKNRIIKFSLKTKDYKNKIYIFEPKAYFFNIKSMTNFILKIEDPKGKNFFQISIFDYELIKFKKNNHLYLQYEINLPKLSVIFRFNTNFKLKEVVLKYN